MDWFQRWPKDALVAVSNHFLANYDIVCTTDVKHAVVQTMGEVQVCALFVTPPPSVGGRSIVG